MQISLLGLILGFENGPSLGLALGDEVGDVEWFIVGLVDGFSVGVAMGDVDGIELGLDEAATVGTVDRVSLGCNEGEMVGINDGDGLDRADGWTEGPVLGFSLVINIFLLGLVLGSPVRMGPVEGLTEI